MTNEELKKLIEDHFMDAYKLGSSIYEMTKAESFEENIKSLLLRDTNINNRIKELQKIEIQYKCDQHKAYNDAYADSKQKIEERITKEKAIAIVREMKLSDIIDIEAQS